MWSKSGEHVIKDYQVWLSALEVDEPRFLHFMLLIGDPDASLRFYRDGLGMKLLGGFDVEERRVTAYFVGFEAGGPAVELAHYWDREGPIPADGGYRHLAVGVPGLDTALDRLEAVGAAVTMRPVVLVDGMPRVAFVTDPDGYYVELFEMRRR